MSPTTEAALAKTWRSASEPAGIIRRIREFVKRSEPAPPPDAGARIVEERSPFRDRAAKRRIRSSPTSTRGWPPVDADPI